MNPIAQFRTLSRLRKTAVILLLLFGAYLIGAGLVLPGFAKTRIEGLLTEQLHRETSIGKIRINPFLLSASVEDLSVLDTDGSPFVAFRGFSLNIDPLASIVRRAVCIKYLRLTEPDVRIRITADGTPNFADLMESEEAETPEPEEESAGELPAVIVGKTTVENGRVEFVDESQSEPFQVEVSPVDLDLSRFGTRLEESTPYDFVLRINEGANLHWKGTVSSSPPGSTGSISLESVRLSRWKYLSEGFRFQIFAGSLRAKADYDFDGSGDEPALTVSNGELATDDIEIGSKRLTENDIAIPSFVVSGITYDLGTNTLGIASAKTRDGELKVALAEDGDVSLQRLFTPTEQDSTGDEEPEPTPPPASDDTGTPFRLNVESVEISNYTIGLEDAMGPVQASLAMTAVDIGVENFSLAPDAKSTFTMGFDIQETGRIDTDGTFGIDPFFVNSHIVAKTLPLPKFDPYVSRGANLSVDEGTADLDVNVTVTAESTVSIEKGRLEVSNLATTLNDSHLAGWKSLTVSGFALTPDANHMAIEEVGFTDPSVALHIDPQGTLNFSELSTDPVVKESAGSIEDALEEAETEGDPFSFRIGAIRISDGAVSITDESVDPKFAMNVTDLQTVVENLTTDETQSSDISIAAKVDETGSLESTAEINPLASVLTGDVDLELSGIDARAFSPYLYRGIGYRIVNGQLGVIADYKIDNDVFDSKLEIQAEEFKVKQNLSLDPTKILPLGLAVEALKDTQGNINVELPVQGNRQAPDYKPGAALRAALVSLITRAAASPFGLVGKLAGFLADDLKVVDFEPGMSDLDSLQAQKLDALGDALLKKEALILQITGAANPELDVPGLAKERIERRMREIQFEKLKGKGPDDVGDVVLTDRDRTRILSDLYEEQFGESLRSLEKRLRSEDKIGKDDDEDEVLADAMIRRLAKTDPPLNEDLRALAERRATQMRDRVAAVEGLGESRVRVLEPNLDARVSAGQVRAELGLTTE